MFFFYRIEKEVSFRRVRCKRKKSWIEVGKKERKKRKRFGFKRKLREERTTGVLKKRGGGKGKIKGKGLGLGEGRRLVEEN